MKNFANMIRQLKKNVPHQPTYEDTVAKIKAEASHHTNMVNNSLKVLRSTDCPSQKRTHLQIVKERLSSVKSLTKDHNFLKVSVETLSRVEHEIHKAERDLHHEHKSGVTHIPNPTQLIKQIKVLKSEEQYSEAAQLLMHCIKTSEQVTAKGFGVAPWYYEQLAEIFHIQKEYSKEVTILERYLRRDKSPGQGRAKLFKRLDEARRLQGH